MNTQELTKQFNKLGEEWLKGYQVKEWQYGKKKYKFLPEQIKFLNSKARFQILYGGLGSGKTLAMLSKMLLLCWFFPNSEFLLGRRYVADLEKTILPLLWELIPNAKWYKHRVKSGIVEFFNGSKIIFFGLDALMSGSLSDIRKANQSLKGMNLSGFALDQAEEIEKSVFLTLCGRLRRTTSPIRCAFLNMNPANFWVYPEFIQNVNKRTDFETFQFSMLDNPYLPDDYLQDQLQHDENYIQRYVKGNWDISLLLQNNVFATEYIKKFEAMVKEPIAVEEGFEIWEQPMNKFYQIGVDGSEGVIDPSSISVISSDGQKVAKFNGKIPIPALIEKTRFIYEKYNKRSSLTPLIIPEVNASGQALLLGISDLNIYRRTTFDTSSWGRKETQKLGWKTSYQTKQALISNFQDLLRKDLVSIYDKQTCEEFKTFVWNDSARQSGAGAERSFHDDDVISTLLGFWEMEDKDIITSRKSLFEQFENYKEKKITFEKIGDKVKSQKKVQAILDRRSRGNAYE
ncbi:MAG: phage terminase large subunit [Patescibacteria group bacterium]|nr:phage terminase large subunit [Patescibacteria group bacterium]